MLELTHHDDGKGKWQSHTVSMIDNDGKYLSDFNFSALIGIGETYDEALKDFKIRFSEYKDRLDTFEKLLFQTDILIPIQVDCFGRESKE